MGATTEKFEALCRAGSLRQALAEVGCLVVDEIHLLGDAARGPVLEALLARVRGEASAVRIVGLSATVANAHDIAGWLGAQMVPVTWRPTRLIWQLPMIAATSDWKAANAARARLAAALTRPVAADEGSVLVFCGSKHNVRATALAIAADRGVRVDGVDPADVDRVHQVCGGVGVGLHYKDWPHKHDAERRFRSRELDVLVATTTVAAGVNLPARAVIVRDTRVGLDDISVATVQQMFGTSVLNRSISAHGRAVARSSSCAVVVTASSSTQYRTARNGTPAAPSRSRNETVRSVSGRITRTSAQAGAPRHDAGSVSFTQCNARSATVRGGAAADGQPPAAITRTFSQACRSGPHAGSGGPTVT